MTVTERKRRHSPHQPVGRWIRPKKRLEIYWRDDWTCLGCGRDLCGAPRSEVTLDHIVPRQHGGLNCAGNLYTSCRSCNSRRGAHKQWLRDVPSAALAAARHPINAVLDRGMRHPDVVERYRLLAAVRLVDYELSSALDSASDLLTFDRAYRPTQW